MGIHGLPAFIRSRAKECMRDLKLADLHGKSVAIDGNILTQRFHHSTESEHPNRTILGWYRFIKNLKSYSITPIAVFDGSRRVSAKAKELERRLNARQLLAGRAESEDARAIRLRQLQNIAETLSSLDTNAKKQALQDTQQILKEATESMPVALSPQELQVAPLATRFAHLTLDMQATKAAELSSLSKRQLLIAENETKAFMQALEPVVPSDVVDVAEEVEDPMQALQTLVDESTKVAEEYGRRSTPVSKQTYTDCMDILRALGVPVILTSSNEPQEAESLCSSLVTAGYAEVVITEDTDVLAFDSPMLRHVGQISREGELLHGREVREALGFTSREQWVDFCLLCGCDFIERIKGLGPVTAYKLLLKHGSIENILNTDVLSRQSRAIKPPADIDSYLTDIAAARAIFLTPVPVDGVSKEDLALKKEDPNLPSIMRGFGLDAAQLAMETTFRGEERSSDGSAQDVDVDEAFGFKSLNDSPRIPEGHYDPAPGYER